MTHRFCGGQADQDGDNRISEEEYRNVLKTPQARELGKQVAQVGAARVGVWRVLMARGTGCFWRFASGMSFFGDLKP